MNVVGGVGGIFTKSAAGFQRSGISGLASGTARGIGGLVAGAAAGAVGAVARVVEGVDATVGAAQDQVKGGADAAAAVRRRLPLATRGDGIVRRGTRTTRRVCTFSASRVGGIRWGSTLSIRRRQVRGGAALRRRVERGLGRTGEGGRLAGRVAESPPRAGWRRRRGCRVDPAVGAGGQRVGVDGDVVVVHARAPATGAATAAGMRLAACWASDRR